MASWEELGIEAFENHKGKVVAAYAVLGSVLVGTFLLGRRSGIKKFTK